MLFINFDNFCKQAIFAPSIYQKCVRSHNSKANLLGR